MSGAKVAGAGRCNRSNDGLSVNGFGMVMLAASVLGALAACLSALGSQQIYERVGRGYLDVAAADPAEQTGTEPLELTEVREMLEATETLRSTHGQRSRAAQERISELLSELEQK
jgi:hypothetical protein